MALLYPFGCDQCHYRVETTGEAGRTAKGVLQSFVCSQHREIYTRPLPARSFDAPCPGDERHMMRAWSHPGSCPKCGGRMRRGTANAYVG